jgi:hypothetical protein
MYEKIFALDACFKLSLKGGNKKRSEHDTKLASGNGVFVNEEEYQSALKKWGHIVDVRDSRLIILISDIL